MGSHDLALGGLHREGALAEVDLDDVLREDPRLEALGLLAEQLHQLRPGDPVREARVVLDLGREHELSAGEELLRGLALEDQRIEVRSRRVDRAGPAGGAGSDDDELLDAVVASCARSA